MYATHVCESKKSISGCTKTHGPRLTASLNNSERCPLAVARDVLSEAVVKVVIVNHVTVRTCFGFLILSCMKNT